MNIVIVGAGSIGKRHASNFLALGWQNLTFVRHRESPVEGFPGIPVVTSLDAAVNGPETLVMVCNPAPMHLKTAARAIEAGCHVFIEKPLSDTWRGVPEFLKLAERSPTLTWVGYDLRFDTGLERIKEWMETGRFGKPLIFRAQVGQFLPDWRPGTDYRSSVSARRDTGGGVLLELSHEVDYARWLLGSVREVFALTDTLLLDMSVEDAAIASLVFESGAIGSIEMDCLQRSLNRNCQIVCSEAVITWDFCSRTVRAVGGDNCLLDTVQWESEDRDTRFQKELSHVIQCIEGRETPRVTAWDGADTLRLVLAMKDAARLRKVIEITAAQEVE